MYIECAACGGSGDSDLPEANGTYGFLSCSGCGAILTTINVADWSERVERVVQNKLAMQRSGRIGTRKQSTRQSDADISRDGIAAELAACLLIAPSRREAYWRAAEIGGGNRGRDLTPQMTGLDKPIEVKQTRYRTAQAGYLIVRPPRMTPGRMLTAYIEDSYYLLLHGQPFRYEVLGWADRERVVSHGKLNPIPQSTGQRECWGIHWSQLLPLESLAQRFAANAE